MDLKTEQEKRKEFCDILFGLAKDQEMLQDEAKRQDVYERLEKLYYSPNREDRYRHFYSDIFTVLTQIQQDPKQGDINILGQNLSLIRMEYRPQNRDEQGNIIDISDSIRKLYDHVSLDIARILYSANKNARAPSWIAAAISFIRSVPSDCFFTLAANPAATNKAMMPMIGIIIVQVMMY